MENLAYIDIYYETIGGRPRMMSPASVRHSGIAGKIYLVLTNYLKGKQCKVFQDVWLRLDGENTVAPDLLVVCDKNKVKDDAIYGAPDLVIEILSPSTAEKDRITKKRLYEKHGVKEYWIVSNNIIEVYKLDGSAYADAEIYHYDSMESKMLERSPQIPIEKRDEIISKSQFTVFGDLTVSLKEIFNE